MKKRRKKKKQNKGMALIVIIVVVFCAVTGFQCIQLKKQSSEWEARQRALERQQESEEQRKKELEELEKYMKTKKFMEEVAKDKLGLVYPDEILIQPNDS